MSPYFPKREEVPPYHCQGCGGWYHRANISCCVNHAPGTCCHLYETPAAPPTRDTSVNPVVGDRQTP